MKEYQPQLDDKDVYARFDVHLKRSLTSDPECKTIPKKKFIKIIFLLLEFQSSKQRRNLRILKHLQQSKDRLKDRSKDRTGIRFNSIKFDLFRKDPARYWKQVERQERQIAKQMEMKDRMEGSDGRIGILLCDFDSVDLYLICQVIGM